MPRITHLIPWEQRFRINRMIVDSAWGDWYMKSRRAFAPYRAHADADLIVDGFPRSANTYALFASEEALGNGRVRGHTHAAATLHRGVGMGIPTLLIIRDPRDAVSSLVQLANGVSARTGFDAYARFHSRVLPIKNQVCIAEFSEVVDDFGAVLERVNDKFGVSLNCYRKTDEAEARIRSRIDASSAQRQGGKVREAGVARPSDQRRSASEVLNSLDSKGELAAAKAEEVYRELKLLCA